MHKFRINKQTWNLQNYTYVYKTRAVYRGIRFNLKTWVTVQVIIEWTYITI